MLGEGREGVEGDKKQGRERERERETRVGGAEDRSGRLGENIIIGTRENFSGKRTDDT